jgi:hypothetical protein
MQQAIIDHVTAQATAPLPTGFVDQITAIVLGYGLIGAVAAVLAIAVVSLYKRNQTLNDALFKVGQDAITASILQANAYNAVTKGLESQQAAISRMNDNMILLTAGKRNAG